MSDGLKALHFHCRACGARFEAEPSRIQPVPMRDWQLHDYFAACLKCGAEAPQAAWELNIAKAWANATGPKTPDGIAATSANLAGHPTPEEAKRTRFNAMKTGLFAKTAQYWPAKPGKYPHCASCEHFNKGCNDDDHRGIRHENPVACLKRVELFMRYQIAFETRDPKMLVENASTLQALAWQTVNDLYLQVIQDGTVLRTKEWYYDKDGKFHLAGGLNPNTLEVEFIYKIEAHPALRYIIEFMNRNGMTLPDSGMTVKVQDEQESVRGFLENDTLDKENSLDFRERQTKALEGLEAMVARSQGRQARDPVLLEHQAIEHEQGGGGSAP